jgi:hypothetical protein
MYILVTAIASRKDHGYWYKIIIQEMISIDPL